MSASAACHPRINEIFNVRLTTTDWKELAHAEKGISESRFYELLNELENARQIAKSRIDKKWDQIRRNSGNWYDEKDQ